MTTKDFSEPTQNPCAEHDAAASVHVHGAQVKDQSQKTPWTWCLMVLSSYARVTGHFRIYPTRPYVANKHIWKEKWEICRTLSKLDPSSLYLYLSGVKTDMIDGPAGCMCSVSNHVMFTWWETKQSCDLLCLNIKVPDIFLILSLHGSTKKKRLQKLHI